MPGDHIGSDPGVVGYDGHGPMGRTGRWHRQAINKKAAAHVASAPLRRLQAIYSSRFFDFLI
jgi:hypothetical protein